MAPTTTLAQFAHQHVLPRLDQVEHEALCRVMATADGRMVPLGDKPIDEIGALDAFMLAAYAVSRGHDAADDVGRLRRTLRRAHRLGVLRELPDFRALLRAGRASRGAKR